MIYLLFKKFAKVFTFIFLFNVYVNAYANEEELEIVGTAVILLETSTGRILYERNIDELVYPASMIKVLTAIVLLDYLLPEDVIRVGNEIYYVPFGSSRAGHIYGEHITGLNLLRGLLLPSGNDTANIVASHVSYVASGYEMPFSEAEEFFANMMNERARQIGANSSNFTNAHGFHNPYMKVTVRDLATIAMYALNINVIRDVASEISYVGYGLPWAYEGVPTTHFSWNNTNRLLVGEYYNPYAIGLKTGFHTPAGWTFTGAAYKDGIELVSVIAGSYSLRRWEDTNTLFNYAFENYEMRQVHVGNNLVEEIHINNPRWGQPNVAQLRSVSNFSYYLSEVEFNSIQKRIEFSLDNVYTRSGNETYYQNYYIDGEDYEMQQLSFVAPLFEGEVMGNVIYTLNGEEIFRDYLVLSHNVYEWSYISSFLFVVDYLRENPFSIFGLSFILGVIFLLIVAVNVFSFFHRLRKGRSTRASYSSRSKFKYTKH